ncbi:MAG: biopolymer transporter ExbD [Opitutales bacterium]|nr:biopolymer transporter ExbD [Opitutales bacterium]
MRRDMLDLELSGETEINLSPMIDCIFILLIFFIVTTVFVQESGIDVEKPEASNSTPLPKNSILIAITETGRIYHGGKEISLARGRPIVHRILAIEDAPVIIQADRASIHDTFAKVYGEVKAAGGKDIHFATNE